MAFNLNKNEASNLSTRFDLSKGSAETELSTASGKAKPKNLAFCLTRIVGDRHSCLVFSLQAE